MTTLPIHSVIEWPKDLSIYNEIIDVRSPLEFAEDHPPRVSEYKNRKKPPNYHL
jgi:rhodanese-related sulfurtransferase